MIARKTLSFIFFLLLKTNISAMESHQVDGRLHYLEVGKDDVAVVIVNFE